jgi:HK97 family phage major capsid protein
MSPKTVAGRVVLSNLLLETSQPTADQIIEQDLAQQLGLAVDSAVLKGGGVGQPTGIMADGNVATVDTDLTATVSPTVPQLLEFIDTLMDSNALKGSLGWIMHPQALTNIRQIRSENASLGTANLEVSRFMLSEGPMTQLLGYPFSISTQMDVPGASDGGDDYSILFGNFADVMVARWGGLRLLASNTSDDAFSKDQTHIRATMRMDCALRHPESFVYSFTA